MPPSLQGDKYLTDIGLQFDSYNSFHHQIKGISIKEEKSVIEGNKSDTKSHKWKKNFIINY